MPTDEEFLALKKIVYELQARMRLSSAGNLQAWIDGLLSDATPQDVNSPAGPGDSEQGSRANHVHRQIFAGPNRIVFTDDNNLPTTDATLEYIFAEYVPGAQLDTGSVTVTAEGGMQIPYSLTIGEWYCIEGTNGPWHAGPGVSSGDYYNFELSLDGSNWSGQIGRDDLLGYFLTLPSFAAYAEAIDANYGRVYFQAQSASVWFRCSDDPGTYPDNYGTFGYILKSATVGEYRITLSDVEYVIAKLANAIHTATAKSPPVGADELVIWNSVDGTLRKMLTSVLKTFILSAQTAERVVVTDASGNIITEDLEYDATNNILKIGGIEYVADRIHNATSQTEILDADEIGVWEALAGALRKATAKLFKTFFSAWGSEEIVNGYFDVDASGWVLGAGWAWESDGIGGGWVRHTVGNTADLYQVGDLSNGNYYHLGIYVGGTTGSVTVGLGDGDTFVINAGSGAVSKYGRYRGGSGQKLWVGVTTDFDGYVDNFSMQWMGYIQEAPISTTIPYVRKNAKWEATSIPPATTAANDFQVGNGSGNWITKTLAQTITILRTSLDGVYAAIANGVTNGDNHDHSGGDGAQIAHTSLSSIGTKTHAQIDTHITTLSGRMYLPFGVYSAISPMSTTSIPYTATIDRTITYKSFAIGAYVDTTNNASNYWVIQLQLVDGTNIKTLDTSAGAANVFNILTAATFDVASHGAANKALRIIASKTGSPGLLFLTGPMLEVEV